MKKNAKLKVGTFNYQVLPNNMLIFYTSYLYASLNFKEFFNEKMQQLQAYVIEISELQVKLNYRKD